MQRTKFIPEPYGEKRGILQVEIPAPKKKRISVASAKDKGRRLQKMICKKISELTGIEWGKDCAIESRPMGQCGADVRMEASVLKLFPFATECKYQETWSIYQWMKQAIDAQKRMPGTSWVLFVRKNDMHPTSITVLDTEAFFRMLALIPEKDRDKIAGTIDNKGFTKN